MKVTIQKWREHHTMEADGRKFIRFYPDSWYENVRGDWIYQVAHEKLEKVFQQQGGKNEQN